jgi:signal transduction histidine kinase
MLGLVQDITERKQYEEAVKEANQKLRLLTGITRHDIFNQLSVIQGLLNLATEESDPLKMNAYIFQSLEVCNLIESTIRFTREYENFGIISSGWHFVNPIIESAKNQVSSGEVIIQNQIPDDLEIYADPIIRKVFSTLLENSVRHGGEITGIRFSCSECEGTLTITGEDDGVGIPYEEKSNIFVHGYGKHTGIGLFLAREILSITGLSIRECGVPGEGARFEILVPAGKYQRSAKTDISEGAR